MTKYIVINDFRDLKDDKYKYKAGDEFPREGKRPSKKRLEELSEIHPEHKKAFIKAIEEPKTPENEGENEQITDDNGEKSDE